MLTNKQNGVKNSTPPNVMEVTNNRDQLSLTNPRDALHHDERAANTSAGRSV